MPYLHNYRLFISHAWRYSEGYERIIRFINAAPNFRWSNYSIPEAKAFVGLNRIQLQNQLKHQMSLSQCAVVLAGMYVNHSDWIQFEINYLKSLGKPILGVVPWGAQRTPYEVSLAANEMVNWNSNSIVAAIRRITP